MRMAPRVGRDDRVYRGALTQLGRATLLTCRQPILPTQTVGGRGAIVRGRARNGLSGVESGRAEPCPAAGGEPPAGFAVHGCRCVSDEEALANSARESGQDPVGFDIELPRNLIEG